MAIAHPAFRSLGGAELVISAHVQILQEAGYSVAILCLDYDAALWAPRLRGVEVRCARQGSKAAFRRPLERSRRWLETNGQDFDAIIAHNYPMSTHLGRSQIRARKLWYCHEPPRVLHPGTNPRALEALRQGVSLRAMEVVSRSNRRTPRMRVGLRWRPIAELDQEGVAGLNVVIANSEATRAAVEATYGRSATVIYPTSCSPKAMVASPLARRPGLRIYAQSRLEHFKNLDGLLLGFSKYRERFDREARLDIVGDGSERTFLTEMVRALGLTDCVSLHGFVPDAEVDRLAASCAVFALLPFDEPFGMVFVEAAERGLLVLGPDHGGPRQILGEGRGGWLTDVTSPDAIAETLREIADTLPEEQARRRETLRQHCLTAYGKATAANKLLDALGAGAPSNGLE